MASTSNAKGSSEEGRKNGNKEDRISSLPDCLLVHILSFLPTNYSFRTSILSSRWKCLWASVPVLDFDNKFSSNCSGSDLMNFVDRILLNHDCPCIQKFRIRANKQACLDTSRIFTWISVAIKRGVKELDINIPDEANPSFSCPLSLFTCSTLVVLKLRNLLEFISDVPCSIHFRSLKVLHVSLTYRDSDWTQNLFYNCPVLEDLLVEGNVMDYEVIFNVSAPALKSCKLDLCGNPYDETGEFEGTEIIVNAPRLEYLTLKADYLPYYVFKSDLFSLVEADVDVDVGDWSIETDSRDKVVELLAQVKNVKYLSLGLEVTAALDWDSLGDYYEHLDFANLIRLELHVDNCNGWKHVLDLLDCMALSELVLKKERCCSARFDLADGESEDVPLSLENLKEIELSGFRGQSDELRLIEYLLRNGRRLHKMVFSSCTAEKKRKKGFFKKVKKFPRASRECKIVLSSGVSCRGVGNHV